MDIKRIAVVAFIPLLLISVATADTTSLLADAVEKHDLAEVRELLTQSADVNAPQVDGMTPLHWAVYNDEYQTAKLLVDADADVEAVNRYGVMPLSLAAQNGNAEIVNLLLSAGANPNAKIRGGETILMTAARTGKLRPVKSLLASGASIDAKERRGQTALMWAAAEGNLAVVDELLSSGADFRTPLRSGFTSFFFAIRQGHTDVVLKLLEAGVDVNEKMRPKKAAGKGPKQGTSPLILATENGHFALALALLEAGADPNDQSTGYSALHAISWVRKPIGGDGAPPPIGSGKLDSLELVRQLVARSADVNIRHKQQGAGRDRLNKTDATPFLLAAETADLPLMRLLLELGADPSLDNADQCTPLLAAAGVGVLGDGDEAAGTEAETLEAVKLLLELGADINAVEAKGSTAMHGAAYKSRPKLIQLLSDRGADVNVWNRKNKRGWTPLMIAAGKRPGNFRPSQVTVAAVQSALSAAGVEDLPNYNAQVQRDIEYATVDEHRLLLDLYLHDKVAKPPLVVWIHGGAWRKGNKNKPPAGYFLKGGFAFASINYRLSPVAKFPAQIHDCKAAVRFLRAQQKRFGYDASRIAVAGSSAGGHLAALLGVSNGHPELEGSVGSQRGVSSDVHAIVDLYGPTNFLTILQQSTQHGLGVRVPALELLLGGQPEEQRELAKLASPVSHVDAKDPPLLIIHGDEDPQVPIAQSHEMVSRYEKSGRDVTLEIVSGGVHGGKGFSDKRRVGLVTKFLRRHLQKAAASKSSSAVGSSQ